MAMNGGETDRSPRSDERAQGGIANSPHSDGGDRRSLPVSSNEVGGNSQSLERTRSIRVRVRFESSEREEGVRLTGLGWSGLTHSG
jgi:hypothetical protein